MSPRLSPLAALVVLAASPALAANLPCLAVDPCVIDSSSTISVGLYDIRPRSLVIGNKEITISGAGEFKVLANNVTFQPGARVIATGTDGQTTVSFDAAGVIDIQSEGTSKSKIDVSGNFGGGTINLTSVGNLTVNGTLIANAANLLGFGGPINILSATGAVTITGDPSEGIRSFGNSQGGGGAITVEATLGAISISTQLVAKGGDCGSCSVDLAAGTTIATTAQGVMDLRASGFGDGGFFSATAGGDIDLAGNILANGSSDDMDGGAGGDIAIQAGGSVIVGGRIEVNGAGQDAAPGSTTGSVDGDGGTVDISAGSSMTIDGPIFGISKGFGVSDEFSFDSLGDMTLAAEMDIGGDNFGGDITAISDGLVTVSARLRSSTPIDPVNKPSAFGGTIDIEACRINVTSNGQLISTGAGGDPSGSNDLVAANGIVMAGTMTATAVNEFDYRTDPPLITGAVSPAATLVNMPNLPCCGPACPTTTTSTSTTATTSTNPSSSTSSSTVTVPTTSSSTVMGTTSSSSTIAPTSSSTSTVVPATSSTTSSTTTPSTTQASTSTTPASTTLATPTSAPTTSTTSVATSPSTSTLPGTPTTSTTVPPTSCLETAPGIDAVRCRLDRMSTLIGQASEDELGGHKLSRQLAARITKATGLVGDPQTTKRLKKAARLLKGFSNQLAHGLVKRKTPIDPALGAELGTLVGEARAALAGFVTG